MIVITGDVRVAAEDLDQALRVSLEHVHRSREEPGCVSHAVHQDAEDPTHLVFFEEWSDIDSVRAHFAVPASLEFVEQISVLATEPPRLRVLEADEVTV